MKRFFVFVILLATVVSSASAKEVQNHGVVFEQWIRDQFFEGYKPSSYTQKWDVPASQNKRFGGIPVNPKATKYKGSVDLGDAIRQYQIDEPFWLVIGYWQQHESKKRFVNVVATRVEPEVWKSMWGEVTLADLRALDALIKQTPDAREARKLAAQMKRQPPFSSSIISLNPKIDSYKQRRLQASLSFARVFKHLAPNADSSVQQTPQLWGEPVTLEIESPPRRFERPKSEVQP
jgi:hypothetical protein